MYTELHYNVRLKKETPDNVIKALQYMLSDKKGPVPDDLPDHSLFNTRRWDIMLRCSSAYFAAISHSVLKKIDDDWTLCVRSNFKSYDEEIYEFIDFMNPYVDTYVGDFLGFHRYEEYDEPTLIYKTEEKQGV